MRWRIALGGAALLGLLISLQIIVAAPEKRTAELHGLPADLKVTAQIPDPKGNKETGDRVTLWVEGGWLLARRESQSGELEWQIVLARATDARPPEIKIDSESRSLSIHYRTFFVREMLGHLRVLRERKDSHSPAWPTPPGIMEQHPLATAGGTMALTRSGNWHWVMSGPSDEKPDVRLRLQHAELGEHPGAQGFAADLARAFSGDAWLQDEGDLLVARRTTIDAAEAQLAVRKMRRKIETEPPPLDSKTWLNTSEELSLEKLKGKVVLLDFWGQWCVPCVKKLPRSQDLYTTFKSQGLVVIGVHSADRSENVDQFLKSKTVSFPVMIDRGETAKRYLVDVWPTYFLIDKKGKVVSGFVHDPPDACEIERLLAK
jgi:thiol-disulfide isomerase/thioredoxin